MSVDSIIKLKQEQRKSRIADRRSSLGKLTSKDSDLLNLGARELHEQVIANAVSVEQVWKTYTRAALDCHDHTNCLTELIDFEKVNSSSSNTTGSGEKPLLGVPVSLKDNFGVGGYDASMGFVGNCFKPKPSDSSLVRLLRDAGAVLYVKTNIPAGMMSAASSNPIFGTTGNPVDPTKTPGGSSSGEGALIKEGGSRVGIGTDIGGSVRIPAHYCGIYSLRCTYRRFPRAIDDTPGIGFEGVPDVASPMAKTMDDLKFFLESVFSMKPWEYCFQLHPVPWRASSAQKPQRKIGVLRSDDYLVPTPACERALDIVVNKLKGDGVDVVEFKLPQPGHVYDECYASLTLADGLETVSRPLLWGEKTDYYVRAIRLYARLPFWIRRVFEWTLTNIFGQRDYAADLRRVGPYSATEFYKNVFRREQLRSEFHDHWQASGIDALVMPAGPTPAIPVDLDVSDSIYNYSAIFNVMDYPAGVIPVTEVDAKKDKLRLSEQEISQLNWQSQSYLNAYDPEDQAGLPLGVQVVGKTFNDEQVLGIMEYIDSLLHE